MLNVMWRKQITGDWRECGRFSIDSYYGNCRSEEAFVAIRSGVMAGVFTDYANEVVAIISCVPSDWRRVSCFAEIK